MCSVHEYSKNRTLHSDPKIVCHTTPSQDAPTHQIWDPRGQGQGDPKMVCDTLPSKDAFTHQIWNSYIKEYRRYAPDSMLILETRSEVKVKVTPKRYATLCHPKVHPHTKFVVPSSNNIRDICSGHKYFKN